MPSSLTLVQAAAAQRSVSRSRWNRFARTCAAAALGAAWACGEPGPAEGLRLHSGDSGSGGSGASAGSGGQSSAGSGGTSSTAGSDSGPSATGFWNRVESEYGYETDIAYGGIRGQATQRVYMCEWASPTAGLYKGNLIHSSDSDVIEWDAEHGLPDYEVVFFDDGRMRFLPQTGGG